MPNNLRTKLYSKQKLDDLLNLNLCFYLYFYLISWRSHIGVNLWFVVWTKISVKSWNCENLKPGREWRKSWFWMAGDFFYEVESGGAIYVMWQAPPFFLSGGRHFYNVACATSEWRAPHVIYGGLHHPYFFHNILFCFVLASSFILFIFFTQISSLVIYTRIPEI